MDDQTLATRFKAIDARLEAIEHQLAVLSEKAGVAYDTDGNDIPARVRDLAAAGKKIDAIRELRAAMGIGLVEAKEIVESL